MPVHRSITRINNNNNNRFNVINIFCCILLSYIILSIILSNLGVKDITIFCIIITSAGCCGCIFYIFIEHSRREFDRQLNDIVIQDAVDDIPTLTAYPIPDNYNEEVTLEAVICQPEDSL
jgi:hypothetical protein